MEKRVRVAALLAVLALLIGSVGCDKIKARDQLNKGVQSYKNGKYEEAIEHFKNSVTLDPSLVTARLYLGTAYMQLYVPGKKKAFSKVARHTLFRVADGREVDFLIPAKKQLKIGEDLAVLGG